MLLALVRSLLDLHCSTLLLYPHRQDHVMWGEETLDLWAQLRGRARFSGPSCLFPPCSHSTLGISQTHWCRPPSPGVATQPHLKALFPSPAAVRSLQEAYNTGHAGSGLACGRGLLFPLFSTQIPDWAVQFVSEEETMGIFQQSNTKAAAVGGLKSETPFCVSVHESDIQSLSLSPRCIVSTPFDPVEG